MRQRSKIVVLGMLVTLGAVAREARARADGAVLVVGKVAPKQRAAIAEAIVAAAREDGWALAAPALSPQDAAKLAACMSKEKGNVRACAAPRLKDGGDKLVFVDVHATNMDFNVTMYGFAAATDAEAKAEHFCNVCSDAELRQGVADATRKVMRDLVVRGGRTKITIESTPDGAWITLDGSPAGSTNEQKATYPGKHTVMLRKDGYVTATRDVEVEEGQTVVVKVPLERAKHDDATAPMGPVAPVGPVEPSVVTAARPSALGPKLLIGAGVVMILGGAVLVAVDEDPSLVGEQPPYIYDTTPHGVAAILAGAAAVGVGAYLWARASRASQPTSSPTIGARSGGVTVGWAGSF